MDRDHPRLRGEHHIRQYAGGEPIGITPAYAGNTETSALQSVSHGDHPRLRGEHKVKLLSVLKY